MASSVMDLEEPSIDTDKLCYEIFSILESKFLFGYDDRKLWIPRQISPAFQGRHEVGEPRPQSGPSEASHGGSAIKNQRGKICILSIDGGGMRSILPGKALAYLEEALKRKSGNPDARIADYFDVASGAGIGGIFTAMLFATKDHNRPIFEADDTWRFLVEQGKRFYRSTSYSGGRFLKRFLKPNCASLSGLSGLSSLYTLSIPSLLVPGSSTAVLEKAMKDAFTDNGRTLTLRDTLKPVLIPCYDLRSAAPFLFSRADALEAEGFNFRLWEVCRATSAEPGLFEPMLMSSMDNQTRCLGIDGGLAMSNPTSAAITHVLHNKQEFPFVRGVEDLLVLSLGTGQLCEGSYQYKRVKNWKAKEWARPMARIFEEGSGDLVDQAVAMAFGHYRSSNYVRIQTNGSSLSSCGPNVDTNPSASNVHLLVQLAEDMLKQKHVESVLFGGKRISEQSNFERLDWFAGELVVEHQRRSCRIAPTVAFKQAIPKTT